MYHSLQRRCTAIALLIQPFLALLNPLRRLAYLNSLIQPLYSGINPELKVSLHTAAAPGVPALAAVLAVLPKRRDNALFRG